MTIVDIEAERAARAGLIKLEVDRLAYEAARPETPPDKLTAIRQEMEVLLESLREIRREQLRDQIGLVTPRPMLPPRRPWWRRWRHRG